MFDLYKYLSDTLVDDQYIKKTYRCTGLARIEELLSNVRETAFPCVVAELGADGWFDILDTSDTGSVQNFYILESCPTHDIATIETILHRTMTKGRAVLSDMCSRSREDGDVCYGIDFSRIEFAKVGPVGMGCYGYAFTLNIIEQ